MKPSIINGESLYIHWPFENIISETIDRSIMERYHHALVKEIGLWSAKYPEKKYIKTLFFGGGVPSTYPNDLLLDMAGILKDTFEFNDAGEITLEVHPLTATPENMAVWRSIGINRLSIDASGRNGTWQDVVACINASNQIFPVISLDLVGDYGNNTIKWKEQIMAVIKLPVNHISISFDTKFDVYQWTVDILSAGGFEQYETMNFARLGNRAQHSQVYWQRRPYKGFGAGACSFDGTSRSKNPSDMKVYIDHIEKEMFEGTPEFLERQQEWLEQLMLSLPQEKGISWEVVDHYLPKKLMQKFKIDVQILAKIGLIDYTPQGFALTAHGRGLADEIVIKLAYDIQ